MDLFERVLTLRRCGRTEQAERMRAEEPDAWLPLWTAGRPLSGAFRWVHELGHLIGALRVDDTFAWALAGDYVVRMAIADGAVHRLRLRGCENFLVDGVFVGDTLVAVEDERLLVWDLANGELLVATDPDDVPRHAGDLCRVAVGAGVAVVGTGNGYLLQWDLADGRLLARVAAHPGFVGGVYISDDGPRMVLSTGGDGKSNTVCFHALDGLRRSAEVSMPEETACGGWTVLDGQRRAVTVAGDGLLCVWDPESAAPIAQFPIPTTKYRHGALAFIADGAWVVLGEARGLQIVDLRDGCVQGTISTDFCFEVNSVAAYGSFVLVAQGGSTEGRVNLLEVTDPLPRDALDRPSYLDAAPAMIDGRMVIVAVGEEGPYRVHGATDGREIRAAGEPTTEHVSVGSTPRLRTANVEGRDLVVALSAVESTTVDPSTGQTRTVPRPSNWVALAAVASRDGLAVTVDLGDTVTVWDVDTLTPRVSDCVARPARVISIALADLHGRPVVLTGADDGVVRWFNAHDLTELPPPGLWTERIGNAEYTKDFMSRPGPDAVTALYVSGQSVVSVVGDTVTCADIPTGELVGPALTHPAEVKCVLPAVLDGTAVVGTSCADQTLRIWDITTGRIVLALPLPRTVRRILSIATNQITVLDDGYIVAISSNSLRKAGTTLAPAT